MEKNESGLYHEKVRDSSWFIYLDNRKRAKKSPLFSLEMRIAVIACAQSAVKTPVSA
jgi:hypothetical protein